MYNTKKTMNQFAIRLALTATLLFLSACSALQPCESFKVLANGDADPGCVFAPRERPAQSESDFRKWVREPDWASLPADRIGVSLAGGGSKASAFGMGVLAGLDDIGYLGAQGKAEASPRVALISSVSGGSYAAYYFFSQAITDRQLGTGADSTHKTRYEHLFADGLTHTADKGTIFSEGLLKRLGTKQAHGADVISNAVRKEGSTALLNRRQSVVRCTQDLLLPGKCDREATGEDNNRVWASTVGMLLPTAVSLVPHHLFNSLFDMGVNMSPSRLIYRRGIGLTYGSTPLESYQGPLEHDRLTRNEKDKDEETVATDNKTAFFFPRIPCPPGDANDNLTNAPPDARLLPIDQLNGKKSFMINCRTIDRQRFPRSIDFNELKEHVYTSGAQGKDELPFWVIQATATKYRSIGGWFTTLERDPFLDSFEMTSLSFGSRRFGFVPGHVGSLSVLDAVSSSAAFLDANQQAYRKIWQSVPAGLFQHALNLNWGFDIANPSVSAGRRAFHRTLPLPVQWLDTAVTNIGEEEEARHDRRRSAFIRLIDGGGAENLGAIGPLRRGIKTLVIADSAQDSGDFGDVCFLKTKLEGLPAAEVPTILAHAKDAKQVFVHIPGIKNLDEHCKAWIGNTHSRYDLKAATGFTTPALLGCITTHPRDTTCKNREGILTRLAIIKPMLDDGYVNDLLKKPLEQCTVGSQLYADKPENEANCGAGDSRCVAAIPCEVARLIAEPSKDRREKNFPQTSTVFTTANSSATLYASYRELARHYVNSSKKAIESAAGDTREFETQIGQQSVAPGINLIPR